MSQQPSFAIQLINKFGFNDASTILYDMVFRTFNADSQRALLSQMKQFVRDHMAKHKVPKYVDFVDAFPMNAAGKILKYKMREEAIEKYGLQKANSVETA